MRAAAVNFANTVGWFPDGQVRFFRSLVDHGFVGNRLAYTGFGQLGDCPTHSQVPYAFKVWAIYTARSLGYDLVFYGDASIYAVNDWKPIEQHILEQGYFLEATEHNLGTWCSDAALAKMRIDREEAFGIPTIVAGCVGFDFRRSVANTILDMWMTLATDGVTFLGSWNNHNGEVSKDPRVKGHRHDQSALSGIAHTLGLRLLPFETHIFYATPPPARATFHCHPTI